MSLTLRVLAPDQSIFDGSADEVILPSTTGQLGILPGHISLLTAIDIGVMRLRINGGWDSIVLTGGFAEVDSDEVTVLVNSAELGRNIDSSLAEAEFQKLSATAAGLEDKPDSPSKLQAQQQMNIAKARLQASQNN